MRTVTIVGASLAGWSVARGLRGGGFDGRITLVGAEPHRPYDRPPLSKAYLAGDLEAGDLSLVVEGEADRVDWVLGQRAVALRPDRTVTLDDGTELAADALVIATGATPRTLPGTDGLGGVHTLRTRDDADTLRRLSGLGEGQIKAVCRRVQSFNPEIATPWSSVEVAALIAKWRELHG